MRFEELVGRTLLGFMELESEQYPIGNWDNAIALYLGKPNNFQCIVIRTENKDYSMYDEWQIDVLKTPIERTMKYKAIGEKILEVKNIKERIEVTWTDEKDQYWLFIKTKTKVLKLGHHWNDCHYPNSIWEFI